MNAASREAVRNLGTHVTTVLSRSAVGGMTALAEEFYAIADLLTKQPRLRRRLADPAVSAEARKRLAESLLGRKVSASAMSVLGSAVVQRWSGAWDLVDALESTGDEVLLAAADSQGVIDSVEDELFRLERILDAESGLTTLLDEATVDGQRRGELLVGVITAKAHPITVALVRHAVITERKRNILLAINSLIEAAGKRRERSVARVVSAVELSDQQQGELAERLSQIYGRRIDVRHAVDPAIRGGLIVHVGDEVIDGSVAARLAQVRSAFVN